MCSKERLKDDIERLEECVKVLCEVKGTPYETRKEKVDRGTRARRGNAFDQIDNPASSSSKPLSKEEILRRYIDELEADLEEQETEQDVTVTTAKMDKIQEMYNDFMVEEMRTLLKETTGSEVETMENVTRESVIASMDAALSVNFSLEDWLKKPEQPKGISRAAWLDHLKMSKKFADCFVHMCEVERTGNPENLNVTMAHAAVNGVDDWEDKYKKGGNPLDRNEHVSKLVAYEIIRRLEEHEYFFCTFCRCVEFNVMQHLAHFASGVHCKYARQAIDGEGTAQVFAFAAKHLLNLSSISDDLHVFYSKQYSSPYLESGARVPHPDKKTIPTEHFLEKIEKKYARRINGDADMSRIITDSAYLASILPDIIKNHKGDIGRELFKEFNDYFGKGKKLFCKRCRVMVSTRALFYKHIVNPYHLNADYLDDGRQLNLLTMSINIHTRETMI